jgi:hypothetical protein
MLRACTDGRVIGGVIMKSILEKKQPCLEEILKTLEETKFHGNITIHYTNGEPRKIEYKNVQELHNNHK